MSWELKLDKVVYKPVSKFDPVAIEGVESLPNPFEIFPSEGVLKAGGFQDIEISFLPKTPQYEIVCHAFAHTEGFMTNKVQLRGIGCSAHFVTDKTSIDFGIVRVGTKRDISVLMHNRGILRAKYLIESTNLQFTVDPEQSVLDGNGKVNLRIRFRPTEAAAFSAHLHIQVATDADTPDRVHSIQVKGEGSYPQLTILDKMVDFGTALYNIPNIKMIKAENTGLADAQLVFNCHHYGIRLLSEEGDTNIIVPAKTVKNIQVVYTPKIVEVLDSKIFIKSSDNRGNYDMIVLKGRVGIPKLTMEPHGIWDRLDFGICRTYSINEKIILLKNEGNIPLNFRFETHLSEIRMEEDNDTSQQVASPSGSPEFVMSITPVSGHLAVGDELSIKIVFRPILMAEYIYNLVLNYEFVKTSTRLKGAGGKSIIRVDWPLSAIDFHQSRVGKKATKLITVTNLGNLMENYTIEPFIRNETNITVTPEKWLEQKGFSLPYAHGICEPKKKTFIPIEFLPVTEGTRKAAAKLLVGDETHEYELFATAYDVNIWLCSSYGAKICDNQTSETPTIDLGTFPVGSQCVQTFLLRNISPFKCKFHVESISMKEFEVSPMEGVLPENDSIQLTVRFRPAADAKYKYRLKIMWDKEPIKLDLVGSGGLGKLEARFGSVSRSLKSGIDFGIIQFNTMITESLMLFNVGKIPLVFTASVKHDDFQVGVDSQDIFDLQSAEVLQLSRSHRDIPFSPEASLCLPAGMGTKVQIRFSPRTISNSTTVLKIASEANSLKVPLKGSGGTFGLTHKGDLHFGNINTGCTYERTITIVNSGTIPTQITPEWSIVGMSHVTGMRVSLQENCQPTDPRSGWCQKQMGIPVGGRKSISEYWMIVRCIVLKGFLRRAKRAQTALTNIKDMSAPYYAEHTKCRQQLFHLIKSKQLTSQIMSNDPAHVEVVPSSTYLLGYGDLSFKVTLNLYQETMFLATLSLKTGIPNVLPYEISLNATSKSVNIYCDGSLFLNFRRQPIGEEEVIIKKIRNVGSKDVVFTIQNENPSLKISPNKGLLKMGQMATLYCTFKPTDESIQTSDVVLTPENAQPIRFRMFGAGGYPKCSLSKYRRFDFGRCMIGKDTLSFLPIVNEGNTMLHFLEFELAKSTCFFKDPSWPEDRYNMLLYFHN